MTSIEKARRQISRIPYRITEDGCHIPTHRFPNAYGYINTNFKLRQTKLHRLVAFAYLGLDIGNEKSLALHKPECSNRACFNQKHIYVGDHKQNMADTLASGHHPNDAKVLCPRGHEYDRVSRRRSGEISRRCSQCRKLLGV